ncbi:histidine phosphatase family protein [Nocardia otitidiscaviarum]|uniref:histidine phosphatase family protein n=1 Tax=Nocardia otitidiscaviarum TaxID=1823 RepID=UPI0004A72F6A|nr:histidine phosphatase family protein [Nocardia otitidiscaviarum]MBF6135973.1 histidine phosphatase family protein [Nocardia otitidiscaviarum]MBF6238016.1 histidine phosphatase family protein [Nocardia otitidiscaviarum]MBF6483728.1 histidine phosphatase family protein [Nocardia otitidiscaviarum]
MTGKLILVRHGETEGNVAKILDTKVPGLPLTERGVAQAKTFGSTLTVPPRRLFSSEALRARQTGGYIEEATGVGLEVLADLQEVQLGELEGSNSPAAHLIFQGIYHKWHAGDLSARVPGGESGHDVLSRYVPTLEQLRAEYLTSTDSTDIVVVSHGAAMRLVSRELTGVPRLFAANNHLDNTETIELLPTPDGGWTCTRWGRYTPPFGENTSPTGDDPMG